MIDTLKIKLGSLAVHVEEYMSKRGHRNDWDAIQSLLSDPEVRAFLDDPANVVLLPVKRNA
jgi:hypothetical protein